MYPYKVYKTYYIGCDDDGSESTIHNSELVYINSIGMHGWCDPLSKLSSGFMNCELKSKFTSNPSNMFVLVPSTIFLKRKEEDPYCSFDRVEFIINNFRVPSNGIVITVGVVNSEDEKMYMGSDPYFKLEWPFQTNTVWKFKNRKTKGKYITLQRSERQSFVKNINSDVESYVTKALELSGLDIVEVNYTMSPEKVYNIMSKSATHVSYVGATWWLSHYMNIPVIDYGEHTIQQISSSIFGVLGAPGMGLDRAQVVFDKQFDHDKMKPVMSFPLDSDKQTVLTRMLKYVESI